MGQPAIDETEPLRRQMVQEINAAAADREVLEQRRGQVWDTRQLQADFEVIGRLAPFVVVRRKSDGVVGSLEFQHLPRLHFNFEVDDK